MQKRITHTATKLFAGFAALCLLLCSCSQTVSQTSSTESSSSSPASTESTVSSSPLEDLTEKVEIVYYRNGGGRTAWDLKDDVIRQQLQKDLNIELNMVCVPTDYESQVNTLIASGSIPDAFYVTKSQFLNFESQGILLNIMPYLDLMPNYTEAFPDIATDTNILYNDKMYILGGKNQRDASSTVKSYYSMWIRQDWLDNIGMTVPKTLNEFYDTVVAFAQNDPDQDGKNDTYGYSAIGSSINPFPTVLGAFGVGGPNSYILKDGKAVLSSTTQEFKNALEYINNLINTGCVDPDLLAISGYDQLNEKIFANQVGIVFEQWSTLVKAPFDKSLEELTPEAEWIQMEPIMGDSKDQYNTVYNVPGMVTSGYVLSANLTKDETKLYRVLKYIDYLSSGDGLNLVSYGIENEHYTIDSTGAIIIDVEKSGQTENGYMHQICGRNEKEYLTTKFPSLTSYITFADKIPYLTGYGNFLIAPAGLNQSDKNAYEQEEISKFMYGNRSLDEFDDFVDTLYSTFSQQQYDDALNAKLKEVGIVK